MVFAILPHHGSRGESVQAARQADPSRFTQPPGEETDAARRSIDRARTALQSGSTVTSILTDPSFQPFHEWPRFRSLIRREGRSSLVTIVTRGEPGTPLVVNGRVLDGKDRPVPRGRIYVYQTSARGWYSDRAAHISGNEGDRKHARLFGYLTTDAEGRFEVRTIRPAGYPGSDLPAHIHVEAERPAMRRVLSSPRSSSTTTRGSPPKREDSRSNQDSLSSPSRKEP